MCRRLIVLMGVVLLLVFGSNATIAAQGGGSCPAIVTAALEAAGNACSGLARNQVCYGNDNLGATFWEVRDDLIFAAPSDRTGLADLQTITTTPLNPETGQWGIAALHLQANVPDTLPGQAVTFLLMGDATLENAVAPGANEPAVAIVATTAEPVELRNGPNQTATVISSVPEELPVTLIGIDDSGAWFEVQMGESGSAWVEKRDITVEDTEALATLPVTFGEGITPRYGPMQAVYFSTGFAGPACHEAPSGLLVESPAGIEVAININALDIRLGTTAWFATTALPNGGTAMIAVLLDGQMRVYHAGQEIHFDAPGAALAITLNDDGVVDEGTEILDPIPLLAEVGSTLIDQATCEQLSASPLLPRGFEAGICSEGIHFTPPPTAGNQSQPPSQRGGQGEAQGCFWPSITTMEIRGDESQTIAFTAVQDAAYYRWYIQGEGHSYQASGRTDTTSFPLNVEPLPTGEWYQMWVVPYGADDHVLCELDHTPPPVRFPRNEPPSPDTFPSQGS